MIVEARQCGRCGQPAGATRFCENCGALLDSAAHALSSPKDSKGSPNAVVLDGNYIRGSLTLDNSTHHHVSNVTNNVVTDPSRERIGKYRDWLLVALERMPPSALAEWPEHFLLESVSLGLSHGERLESAREAAQLLAEHLRQCDSRARYKLFGYSAMGDRALSLNELVAEINTGRIAEQNVSVQRTGESDRLPLWRLQELSRRADVTLRCSASHEVLSWADASCCLKCERLFNSRLVDGVSGLCRGCAPKSPVHTPATSMNAYGTMSGEASRTQSELYDRAEALALDAEEWAWIAGGAFSMGSPPSEFGRDHDEAPHDVVLRNGFWVSRRPVTVEQYAAALATDFDGDAELPQLNISWFDAVEVCNAIGQRMGHEPVYSIGGQARERSVTWIAGRIGVRLLTEAEWEYCCKAGDSRSTTPWWSTNLADYAVFDDEFPDNVGTRKPNPWGLYDMLGNVWEWVWDAKGRYPSSEVTDPVLDRGSPFRICRGGSFVDPDHSCRPARRHALSPNQPNPVVGLRVAIGYRETEGKSQ